MGTSISISDVGPVVEFEYEMDGPGLHVIEGQPGAGKTTILRSVQLGADGRTDVKPTKRDGTKRGSVTVGGKTLRIAKQIREEGELSVDGLGDLDLAGLHSPKFNDAETRDRHRIRALVRLGKADAKADLFYPLLGGEEMFLQVVDGDALKTDDLVEMAARVKRGIEKSAQRHEGQRDTALANMRASAKQAEGVDLDAPCDSQALQAELTAAISRKSALHQQYETAQGIMLAAAEARGSIPETFDPDGVTKALAAVNEAIMERCKASDAVQELERQLRDARGQLEQAELREGAAKDSLQAAQDLNAAMSGWRKAIEAAESVVCPTDDELQAARQAVDDANAAVQRGVEVRKALSAIEDRDQYAEEAKGHDKAAQRLRDAARDTFDVLSEAIASIPGCPLRVKLDDDGDPRLVLETDRSDAEPFDDLSESEKWETIIRMAGGDNRLLVLTQEAFGGMNDSQRSDLDRWAEEHGCYVLSARNVECELRGMRWQAREPALV